MIVWRACCVQHVANYSTITVEILDSPETSADWREECGVEAAPTASASANANAGDELMDDENEYYGDGDDDVAHNALLLYVHRRDPVRRTIGFVSTLWFGGETVAQLRSEVAQATGIDRAHLQLVKYLQYNGKWRVLDDEVAEDTVDSVAGAGDNRVDSSKQTVSDDDEEEDEEEQEEDEGTEMVEMTASTAPTVDGETEPNSATMTAEEVAEELKVAAVVAKEQERRERAEAGAEVIDHRSPYHLEPQQQRPSNASRRKIEGKPYYLKDGGNVFTQQQTHQVTTSLT